MRRSRFIATAAATAAGARAFPAFATGGLDTFSPPPAPQGGQTIRVLLGSGMATPIDGQSFSFGSRTFRGTFSTTAQGQVINTLGLEEYLYSVVPQETPRSWPQETLRAQAVVARTYALSHVNPKREYDVVASVRDQAYGGLQGEHAQSTDACNATAGQILAWQGSIASVSYMSCCGGHTEDPADAWTGGADLPYLRGIVCNYCSASPDYRWVRDVPMTTVQNAFAAQSVSVGTLRTVDVALADASGRAKSIRLSGESGSVEISGATFRRLLGPAVVRSLLIHSIAVAPGQAQAGATMTLEGSGSGHGVGLCQWGSRGLAYEGRLARDILAFYFPGTHIQ
ncbi:MAG: SpoIID/LytB domain-containing protein [Candidatus Eremiobacteraeota bacterium]|nr:SpoIID/LytB domain-containing protein [Candidatus Eremiobacteraeota bacterium]